MSDRTLPPAAIPDVDQECGARLKRARRHLGLTTAEAGEQANAIILAHYPDAATDGKEPLFTERTLRNWERHGGRLGRRFRALAELYGQSPGWLSQGEGAFNEHTGERDRGLGRNGPWAEGDT